MQVTSQWIAAGEDSLGPFFCSSELGPQAQTGAASPTVRACHYPKLFNSQGIKLDPQPF
jgi:hypothetical protein